MFLTFSTKNKIEQRRFILYSENKQSLMMFFYVSISLVCGLELLNAIVLPVPPKLPPHLRPTGAPTSSPTQQVVSLSEYGISTVKSSSSTYSEFGRVVKISNDLVCIMAYDDTNDRNSILVYHIEEETIETPVNQSASTNNAFVNNTIFNMRSVINLESNPSTFDNFGNSFALSDGNMVIGASMDSEELNSSGAVYFITVSESDDGDAIQSSKLYSPYKMKNGMFGSNVAMSPVYRCHSL